jgi:hypothetical protein
VQEILVLVLASQEGEDLLLLLQERVAMFPHLVVSQRFR